MLDRQGEQLDGIEKGMDVMHNELNQASKHITGMEKWCGLCVCPWNRTQKVRDTDAVWGDKKSDVVNKQPRGALRPDGVSGASGASG
jgi:synaptosomal-associated protein 25